MNKVLVVDDKEENLYLLKVVFEGNGFEVNQAKNGIEALEAANANLPDIVISDILMPGMDGFSLCRQWKTDDKFKNILLFFIQQLIQIPGMKNLRLVWARSVLSANRPNQTSWSKPFVMFLRKSKTNRNLANPSPPSNRSQSTSRNTTKH